MEGLELYGSIRHEPDRMNPGTVRSRFGGEMPIGSLPNDPEPDYQTLAEGKLRSMQLETKAADEAYDKLLAERRWSPAHERPSDHSLQEGDGGSRSSCRGGGAPPPAIRCHGSARWRRGR